MTDTTTSNPGVRGQTRSTWRDENHLRGLLLKLITRHPDATRDELEGMYLAKAKSKRLLVDEALRRAFDNDYARIQQPARSPRRTSAEIATEAQQVRNVVLLDLMLPNGKKLRDCTGKECRQAGGWLVKVAERVGARGIVSENLSETEVATIWTSAHR